MYVTMVICYYGYTWMLLWYSVDHVSVMLRHVFETHQPTNPVEELVKAAAAGDVDAVEEVTGALWVGSYPPLSLPLSLSLSPPPSLSLSLSLSHSLTRCYLRSYVWWMRHMVVSLRSTLPVKTAT